MNQQTEEKPGITPDKLPLSKFLRKIMFIKMLCSPVFVLLYWYFCRTLYRFCMYGGVKKRGSILIFCMTFFLAYLICYLVRVRKIKIAEELPEKMNTVKWYGFSKDFLYLLDKENGFYATKCSEEEKDYLRLKYSELPKYKHFFWKLPAYLILLAITAATICGVMKSGTNFNGKLAWYLFDLRHTPIVAKQQENDSTEEMSMPAGQEIAEDNTEANASVREEASDAETGVTSEAIPVQYPDEKLYGTSQLSEKYYEDEDGQTNYYYAVCQYIFSDPKYQKVNDTLQSIYDKKELEYREDYENNGPFTYYEDNSGGYGIDYEERTWYLVNLTYAGEDYVSIFFNDVIYWPGAAHPMSYFSPVTIDVNTGEIADVEEILGCTWSELSQELYGEEDRLNPDDYGFYLSGEEVHFVYRFNYFVDEIVVPREDGN